MNNVDLANQMLSGITTKEDFRAGMVEFCKAVSAMSGALVTATLKAGQFHYGLKLFESKAKPKRVPRWKRKEIKMAMRRAARAADPEALGPKQTIMEWAERPTLRGEA
jgi:hypothetical protein